MYMISYCLFQSELGLFQLQKTKISKKKFVFEVSISNQFYGLSFMLNQLICFFLNNHKIPWLMYTISYCLFQSELGLNPLQKTKISRKKFSF